MTADGAAPEPGTLPASWYTGGADGTDRPDFLVHWYNDDFCILRQSAHTHFEKPFFYLLFGRDRAMLFDTGAGNADVAGAVFGAIDEWLARNDRDATPLVVAHTHNHSDHVAGDAQFAGRDGVTLVAPDAASVHAYYGFRNWPDERVTYDLGDRVLDLIPIPVRACLSWGNPPRNQRSPQLQSIRGTLSALADDA